MTDESSWRDEALDEYKELQANIRQQNEISMRIKNWSVTLGLAGIAVAFFRDEPLIITLSILSSLIFWYTDANWRVYLNSFIRRMVHVERLLSGDIEETYTGPKINAALDEGIEQIRKNEGGVFRFIRMRSVRTPHDLILVSSVIIWVVYLIVDYTSL